MLCQNCGKELPEDALVCPECGQRTATHLQQAVAPEETVPEGPLSVPTVEPAPAEELTAEDIPVSGKKKRTTIAAAVIGVVAVVAVLVTLLLTGVFDSPKEKLTKAVAKTTAAYREAGSFIKLPDLAAFQESQAVNQDITLELKRVNADYFGTGLAEEIGLRMSGGMDLSGRQAELMMTPYLGTTDLLTVELALEDNLMYIGSPELLKGAYYGLNTETLGTDLEAMGTDLGEMSTLGFNYFDLLEMSTEASKMNEQAMKDVAAAGLKLVDSITVENMQKQTVKVNGTELQCAAYGVLIPQSALEAYFDTLEDACATSSQNELTEQMLSSIGFPQAVIGEAIAETESADPVAEAFVTIREMLHDLSDVHLQVFVNDGYLSAVRYANQISGSQVELGLYLGGGERYVDDLSLELNVDDGSTELLVISSGDHGASAGVFTDKLVLEAREYGEMMSRLESSLTCEPGEAGNTFSWQLDTEELTLELEGVLRNEADTLSLELEELQLSENGEYLMALALDYTLRPFEKQLDTNGGVLIPTLTQDELMELAVTLSDNAYEWLLNLMEEKPELGEFLYY